MKHTHYGKISGVVKVKCSYAQSRISWRYTTYGDRGSTVVKVLCYKSEGRWFDPSLCQRIFH